MSQQLSKLYCIVLHTQCTSVDESQLQITWTWKFTRNKTSKTQTLVDVDAVDPPSRSPRRRGRAAACLLQEWNQHYKHECYLTCNSENKLLIDLEIDEGSTSQCNRQERHSMWPHTCRRAAHLLLVNLSVSHINSHAQLSQPTARVAVEAGLEIGDEEEDQLELQPSMATRCACRRSWPQE
jgi:hypothetical protein